MKLIKDLGFDGIDIDWEYPQNPEQGQQMLMLLKEIRAGMDAYETKLEGETGTRPKFVLTIAAPAGEANYKNMPLGAMAQTLDFINLMVSLTGFGEMCAELTITGIRLQWKLGPGFRSPG